MSENTEQKVLNFINANSLWTGRTTLLLAVSGGADSVALVEILANLKSSGKIHCHLHIAHINHLLRDEKSFDDEQYVKSLAKKHNLPATCLRIDVKTYAKEKKLSTETAARDIRLDALRKIARQNNCSAIATAHHKNDNAETIIHRLLRGTGFKGLAGIRPKTSLTSITFIRPLRCLCKTEIEDYLSSRNINWQTDHTNADCRFTRNRIRHRIIPYLQKQSTSDIADLLFKLSEKALKLYEKIEEQAKSAVEKTEVLDTDKFTNCHPLLQVEVIQNLLRKQNIGLQKFTNAHYNKIVKFIAQAKTEKSLQLPSDAIIQKTRTGFFVSHSKKQPFANEQTTLPIPGKVRFADWLIETEIVPAQKISISSIKNKKNNFVEWFDFEHLTLPLVVRNRKKGDKLTPLGLNSPKKIGNFIASAKNLQLQQGQEIIISDYQDIIWLAPFRRSGKAKITAQTLSLLKITIKNKKIIKKKP
ncbi:MAG: tRNA lysidine(34) synthetase TilS [Phycisphaerae bacterium]|jgi:tRNA(Ile)-lysidine synthase